MSEEAREEIEALEAIFGQDFLGFPLAPLLPSPQASEAEPPSLPEWVTCGGAGGGDFAIVVVASQGGVVEENLVAARLTFRLRGTR
jgi:hypothetical protein